MIYADKIAFFSWVFLIRRYRYDEMIRLFSFRHFFIFSFRLLHFIIIGSSFSSLLQQAAAISSRYSAGSHDHFIMIRDYLHFIFIFSSIILPGMMINSRHIIFLSLFIFSSAILWFSISLLSEIIYTDSLHSSLIIRQQIFSDSSIIEIIDIFILLHAAGKRYIKIVIDISSEGLILPSLLFLLSSSYFFHGNTFIF